jgi:hypothetical protein
MLTPMQLIAVKVVRRMHILAGITLDAADAIESRINPK